MTSYFSYYKSATGVANVEFPSSAFHEQEQAARFNFEAQKDSAKGRIISLKPYMGCCMSEADLPSVLDAFWMALHEAWGRVPGLHI